MDRLVLLQNLLDDPQEWADLPLRARLALPVARRFGVFQDLAQRVPVDVELPAHAPLALFLGQDEPTNLCPFVHVRNHPCYPRCILPNRT